MFSPVWLPVLQIFRSIDSNSVKGFPKDPKEATAKARKQYSFHVLLL